MFKVSKEKIIVTKEDFNIEHILYCGQIFSYEKRGDKFVVYSLDKKCEVVEKEDHYEVLSDDIDYFVNFFDLSTNYGKIKAKLGQFDMLKEPLKFGYGIRILKNNKFEMLISFIISANNNIRRIQKIINAIKIACGHQDGSFPRREELLKLSTEDFSKLGAGYRDKYLYEVLRQVDEETLEKWDNLSTEALRKKLLTLMGVGPKVADCILLFGYGRQDVFPVDTWIEQMYNKFFDENEHNRVRIRDNLVKTFGNLSGYAQQYLFFYQRSFQEE